MELMTIPNRAQLFRPRFQQKLFSEIIKNEEAPESVPILSVSFYWASADDRFITPVRFRGLLFEVVDKTGRRIHLSKERWKHIQKHPHMHEHLESIQKALVQPSSIRRYEDDETVGYFYIVFPRRDPLERYLLVSVKFLNGEGFVITSFFTDKMTGEKW